MPKVIAIILAMVGMVIGANMISPVNTAVSVFATPTYSAAVISLADLLPLLLVVIVMMFAVRSID